MGTSAATAASVAGSMAMIFGGTGAGLAGYKMLVRTRGLTDFQFLQYDEKVRYHDVALYHTRLGKTSSFFCIAHAVRTLAEPHGRDDHGVGVDGGGGRRQAHLRRAPGLRAHAPAREAHALLPPARPRQVRCALVWFAQVPLLT